MSFQSLLLKLAFMCGNCEWIQCRIIHDVLLSHFIEWFWSKTNPQMMQGNLGRSFYRELSWSVMARATPSLFSSRVPTVRIFWQVVLLARQGWLHWKMPQVGCNIHGLVRSEMIFSLVRWSHVISSQCVLDGDDDDNDAAAFWTLTCLDNFLSLFDCLRRSVTRC